MIRFLKIVGVMLVALLLLMGCNSSSEPEIVGTQEVEPADEDGEDAVQVGVLAIRSAQATNEQYGPIVNYLEDELGRDFKLVSVDQESQFTLVKAGELDFTMNNPLAAVQLRRMYNTEFLVTFERANTGTQFGGLIIANATSGITKPADLAGKNVTCVAFETAAAGCIFQVYHLLEQGIDRDSFALFTETPSQDNIVLGVLNGTFDAGFIRTGQLEKMVDEGTLSDLSEIVIIDLADDDFYYPHTTRLYPEWPFATLKDTDPALAAEVKDALLRLPADHPALKNAKAIGFVEAIDYTPLDELIELLELRSYDAK